jgi:hypothetical protein
VSVAVNFRRHFMVRTRTVSLRSPAGREITEEDVSVRSSRHDAASSVEIFSRLL